MPQGRQQLTKSTTNQRVLTDCECLYASCRELFPWKISKTNNDVFPADKNNGTTVITASAPLFFDESVIAGSFPNTRLALCGLFVGVRRLLLSISTKMRKYFVESS